MYYYAFIDQTDFYLLKFASLNTVVFIVSEIFSNLTIQKMSKWSYAGATGNSLLFYDLILFDKILIVFVN